MHTLTWAGGKAKCIQRMTRPDEESGRGWWAREELLREESSTCSLVRWNFVYRLKIVARTLSDVINRDRLGGRHSRRSSRGVSEVQSRAFHMIFLVYQKNVNIWRQNKPRKNHDLPVKLNKKCSVCVPVFGRPQCSSPINLKLGAN